MKWLTILAIAAVAFPATYVQSQCFTEDDRFNFVLDTDLSMIADFGLDLFRELLPLDPRANLFFSPYSLWSALSMAYFGSRGNTEKELETALRVSNKIGTLRLWKALELTHQLRSLVGANYTFQLANKIYVDNELPIRTCIKGLLKKEVQSIDFFKTEEAAIEINKFVSNTTSGHIKDLLSPNDLTDALMVLINAAYFKGYWKNRFEASRTRPKDFYASGFNGTVDMMSLRSKFKYGNYRNLGHLLELPYIGNVVSMYVLLPFKNGDSEFNKIVQNLNGSILQDAMGNMTQKTVDLQLPKFKLEISLEEELSKALMNMGVIDLFNRSVANLTTFVEGINLGVDKSIHKAFIEVSEEGVEAAAATAFVINTRVGVLPKDPIFVNCNRPFIFYLYDNDTRNILFLGTFRSPNPVNQQRSSGH